METGELVRYTFLKKPETADKKGDKHKHLKRSWQNWLTRSYKYHLPHPPLGYLHTSLWPSARVHLVLTSIETNDLNSHKEVLRVEAVCLNTIRSGIWILLGYNYRVISWGMINYKMNSSGDIRPGTFQALCMLVEREPLSSGTSS